MSDDPIEREAAQTHVRMDKNHYPHDAGGCKGCASIAAALRATELRVREEEKGQHVLCVAAITAAAQHARDARRAALLEAAGLVEEAKQYEAQIAIKDAANIAPMDWLEMAANRIRKLTEEEANAL